MLMPGLENCPKHSIWTVVDQETRFCHDSGSVSNQGNTMAKLSMMERKLISQAMINGQLKGHSGPEKGRWPRKLQSK